MLEGNVEDLTLQKSIEEYIDINVPHFLQEFCKGNIDDIIKIVNAKVDGILAMRPRQKISYENYIKPAIGEISRIQEATDVIYQEYLEFIEKYYPEYEPISLGGFYDTAKDLHSNNKRSSWFRILAAGLRPGAIVYFKNRSRRKMKIKTITPAGGLQLEGDPSKWILPSRVALVSAE